MRFLRLFVLAIFLLISLTALVFTTTRSSTKSATQDVVPINKTSGLQVLQAKLVGNELKLSIKNNYAQRVTAYVLAVGGEFRVTEDLIVAESPAQPGIRPQQSFERSFTLSSRRLNETVVLQAVVLEDKTGDGDPVSYEEILDTRLGQAVQIKRALKVLERYPDDTPDFEKMSTEMLAALDQPEVDTLETIKDIRPAGAINRTSQEVLSDNIKQGLTAGRNSVLNKINEAKNSPYKKEYLQRMKVYYEALLSRL